MTFCCYNLTVLNNMEQFQDKLVWGSSDSQTVNISGRTGPGESKFGSGFNHSMSTSDAFLFSSSLPVLRHEKLFLNGSGSGHRSIDDADASLNKRNEDAEGEVSLEEIANKATGYVLPDNEDELFTDIIDYNLNAMPSQPEELEEADIFDSLGGMELENERQENFKTGMGKLNLSDGILPSGIVHHSPVNGVGTIAGEHPYGEHPSRTLFVRNINSNVEDLELRTLFEQYGDIRTLYTACKHRGFVMISYYDIRDARTAMRGLQSKPLRRRKLDIHFSIPKDNPSEKDINQGTLVAFNLDPSVSNEDLLQIFGAYGEVKEIRETPHKRHHKFIEFYDVRAAEAALRALNKSDIAGKRIKLEPSRPGGTRRNLLLQMSQDPEVDEYRPFRHHTGSPINNSPPANWTQFNSPIEKSYIHSFSRSPGYRTLSPTASNLPGLASILHSQASKSLYISPFGKDQPRAGDFNHMFSNSNPQPRSNFHHPHSFPELKLGLSSGVSSFGASTSSGSGIEMLSGPEFLWGGSNTTPDKTKASGWSNFTSGHPLTSDCRFQGLYSPSLHNPSLGSSQQYHPHHHVGSAPSGTHFERHLGFFPKSPETSTMSPGGFKGMNMGGSSGGGYMMNVGPSRASIHGGFGGNIADNGSCSFRMASSPRLKSDLLGNGPYPGLTMTLNGGDANHWQTHPVENNANQIDSKKQFQLDLEKIASSEDARTTLMIKNIPNKYTAKMLMAAIDENHKGTYDFLYLPIDFKNKCNVGYAFINMVSPSHIIPFYEAFNGKKWEKFNSEKVASLAYARIQGKAALVAHFQNSSLMNEDKRCRPILLHSEGGDCSEQTIQEHLSSGSLKVQAHSAEESSALGNSYGSFTSRNMYEDKPEKA